MTPEEQLQKVEEARQLPEVKDFAKKFQKIIDLYPDGPSHELIDKFHAALIEGNIGMDGVPVVILRTMANGIAFGYLLNRMND